MRVFGVISDLFLPAYRRGVSGIKTFYFQVKEKVEDTFGMHLEDHLWIPFVWDAVYYHRQHEAQMNLENQNAENEVANAYMKFKNYIRNIQQENEVFSEESQLLDGNMPLSQIPTSGESQPFSDKFNIPSRCSNNNMSSSIDINNIAMSHDPNGSTQNQCQSRSVPLAQQSMNGIHSSADLDASRDIIDDISSTLTHTLAQDINNGEYSSETCESQSIDINSINLTNHVANDSEFSFSIHTSALHSNDEAIQNQDQLLVDNSNVVNESQSIDINVTTLKNHVANDCTSTSGSLTQQSNNDSVLIDEEEDSIASRMKRRRRIICQPDNDDDENNSYEY